MASKKSLIIAVDFDGTCVTHDYPHIGKDIGAVPVLQALVAAGHRLILWTMRSEATLQMAVEWFAANDIPLWGVNKNPEQHWSTSPKAYAQIYIDDAALGCPLLFDERISERDYADWKTIKERLELYGLLEPKSLIGS